MLDKNNNNSLKSFHTQSMFRFPLLFQKCVFMVDLFTQSPKQGLCLHLVDLTLRILSILVFPFFISHCPCH